MQTDIVLNYETDEEYRGQFLSLFDLCEYKIEDIESKTKQLYDRLIIEPKFEELFRVAANLFLSEDLEIGIGALFSYDYLKDFIKCVNDFTTHKETSNIDKLINKLKK